MTDTVQVCLHGIPARSGCARCMELDNIVRTDNFRNSLIDENIKMSQRMDGLEGWLAQIDKKNIDHLRKRIEELEEWTRNDEDRIYERIKKLEEKFQALNDDYVPFKIEYPRHAEQFVELNIKNVWNKIDELEKNNSVNKTPHKCPVCCGAGKRENILLLEQLANPMRFIECNSCEGKGIVWG